MELLEYNNDLRWTEDTLKVNYYYNLYKYKFWARIPYIHRFRYEKDEYQFNQKLDNLVPLRISNWNADAHKTLRDTFREAKIDHYLDLIKDFILWRRIANNRLAFKIKISHDTLEIYSNDLSSFFKFVDIKNISRKRLSYVKKIENYSAEVIYHKSPKHKYRLYFQTHRFDAVTSKSFTKFLLTHDFSLSPSLSSAIHDFLGVRSSRRRSYYYTNTSSMIVFTHYYVDFDDEHLITLLSLFESSVIRRLYRIEKR